MRNGIATKLDDLDDDDEQRHGQQHDVGLEAVVAVADRQVADAAAAHHAGHGGVGEEADGGDGDRQDQAGTGFHQQHLGDDLQGRGAHGLGRLDDAPGHVAQGLLDDAGEIEDGGQG
ncbi:hypothetical protein SDC9_196996 [bioreactor metagenome]|uniref:Uncharacterized protein n=1 Tax=bioreactor metagenome TaxID=1076179 RepID=A0A645IEL0_9ZZZZ